MTKTCDHAPVTLDDLVRMTARPLARPWPRLGAGEQLEHEFWIGDERVGRLVLAVETHLDRLRLRGAPIAQGRTP